MIDLSAIQLAVRQAVTLCQIVQRDYLEKSEKDGKEPVTIADYGSQALICRTIKHTFPDDAVLAEEQGNQFLEFVSDAQRAEIVRLLGQVLETPVTEEDVVTWLDHGRDRQAKRTWVIDPIDGTKGFLAMRHYAIAVGIVEGSRPTGAVMATPGYNEGRGAIFYAQDGKAFMRSMDAPASRQLNVSMRSEPDQIHVVQSFEKGHGSQSRMQRVRELSGLADAPLSEIDSMEKYALVANGDADLYLRLPRAKSTYAHRAWDHAAGAALVLAAGGAVTDVDGSALDFSQGRTLPNLGMVVSNGHIHDRVLKAVQEVMAEDWED